MYVTDSLLFAAGSALCIYFAWRDYDGVVMWVLIAGCAVLCGLWLHAAVRAWRRRTQGEG